MGTDSLQGRIVSEVSHGQVGVVALHGEHDMAGVRSLRGVISSLLENDHAVVVDLGPTTFVDAPVLGVLVRSHRLARERGLGFALQVPPSTARPVRRILDLTAEATGLPVAASREAAVAMASERDGTP